MVEAAMVLPVLILVTFTLLMVMVSYFENHHSQILLHQEMIHHARQSQAAFGVHRRVHKHQQGLDGIVNEILRTEKYHTIYKIRPVQWIRLGGMAGFHEE